MNALEIAWLAGLLEGEGAFVTQSFGQPRITFSSTDLDMVTQVAWYFGTKTKPTFVRARMTSGLGKKQQYETSVRSSTAAGWMMTLYTFMSTRRREQIRKCLDAWKARRGLSYERKVEMAAHMRKFKKPKSSPSAVAAK